jgi:hypothetical protein
VPELPMRSATTAAPVGAPTVAARQPIRSVPRTSAPGSPKPAAPSGRPAAKPASDCSVPYTIDADGIRHAKPECL